MSGGGRPSMGPLSVPVATQPVSEEAPSREDHKRTLALESFLEEHGRVERGARSTLRAAALAELGEIVREWMARLCAALPGVPDSAHARAHIMPFGSYRLAVNAVDADIDTVLLVPQHVNRGRDFFGSPDPMQGIPWLKAPANILANVLRADSRVSGFVAVADTHTPILTFDFTPSAGGTAIEIDMACAPIAVDFLPEEVGSIPDEWLESADDFTMRSLNGTRVADAILAQLPTAPRREAFRTALRLLKFWAQRRGVYSNKMGYLAGVQLAILVCKVCQLYPTALASTVVAKFFRLYKDWPWPKEVELVERVVKGWAMDRQIWRTKPNNRELMPIITPAYPGMNSTFSVNRATLRVLKEELERGHDFARGVEEGIEHWDALVHPTEFFTKNKDMIRVDVIAGTEEHFQQWFGLCEANIRNYVNDTERFSPLQLHCYPKTFEWPWPTPPAAERCLPPATQYCRSFFLAFSVKAEKSDNSVSLKRCNEKWIEQVQKKAERGEWWTADMVIELKQVRRKQIPSADFMPAMRCAFSCPVPWLA